MQRQRNGQNPVEASAPTQRSDNQRRQRAQAVQAVRALAHARPGALVLFFGLAVAACFAAIGMAATSSLGRGGNQGPPTGPYGQPITSKAQAIANARCGFGNKPACPTATVPWVDLRSETPADVLTAAKSTAMFQSALTDNDLIGTALRAGQLGQPMLVQPYRAGTSLDSVWVIPVVVSSTGNPSALLEFVYDRAHHRMYAASFDAVGNGMFYASHPFPFIAASGAAALVQQSRRLPLMAGRMPELVYFPVDHTAVLLGQIHWSNGGDGTSNPMWRVPGSDGHWYYVTPQDRAVHVGSEFPITGPFPAMPQLVG